MKEQKIEFSITYTNFIVLFCICRYLLVYHMIINVMSIVLEFACGRYIVVLFHIMEKFLLLTQVHVNTRYIFNFYVIFFIANVKIISITDIFFEILESKARNTKQMSKCCGQHNEAMLACRPKREARDEGGDAHVRSH